MGPCRQMQWESQQTGERMWQCSGSKTKERDWGRVGETWPSHFKLASCYSVGTASTGWWPLSNKQRAGGDSSLCNRAQKNVRAHKLSSVSYVVLYFPDRPLLFEALRRPGSTAGVYKKPDGFRSRVSVCVCMWAALLPSYTTSHWLNRAAGLLKSLGDDTLQRARRFMHARVPLVHTDTMLRHACKHTQSALITARLTLKSSLERCSRGERGGVGRALWNTLRSVYVKCLFENAGRHLEK